MSRSYDVSHPHPYRQQPPESAPQGSYGFPAAQPIPGAPQQYPHPQYLQYPHSQNPEYTPYAGWRQRAGAFLLDCLINFGPMWLSVGIADVIGDGDTGEGLAMYVSWVGIAYMIGSCIVQAVREGRTGQSVGKTVLGIRFVRTSDGLAPGGALAFARRLCQFLNYPVFCLGWLWASWDDKSQTFADKITGVVVVSTDAAVAPHPAAASW
ncbi:RDD family protein [Streptomyces sp. NPDC029674]|uniref:RDD family protein n=1 Tax=Streptomyces sp. NPDC029674 TaxID=3365297 RepID=UPI003851080E